MAIPLVQVRHKVTGQKTFLPETALRHFPGYVKTPSQKSRDQVPDGTAFPAGEPGAGEPPRPAKNDSTDTWRAYALASGMDAEQADSMSRDELVAHFEES